MYIVFSQHFLKVQQSSAPRLVSHDPKAVLTLARRVAEESEVENVLVYRLVPGYVYSMSDFQVSPKQSSTIAMVVWQREENGPIAEQIYDQALKNESVR